MNKNSMVDEQHDKRGCGTIMLSRQGWFAAHPQHKCHIRVIRSIHQISKKDNVNVKYGQHAGKELDRSVYAGQRLA